MDKNDIHLGSASKQNDRFQKIYPKNALMRLMSAVGPGLIFLVFNTHYFCNLHRAIASSIYNVGKTRAILFCNLDF